MAVADGGIILSRTTQDPMALPQQMMLYREFVRLVFSEPVESATRRPA